MSSAYFDKVRPTYLENWPSALARMSVAQVGVKLSLVEAVVLGQSIVDYGETFAVHEDGEAILAEIRARVAAAVAIFPNGAFVRLGSRSPKDSWSYHKAPKIEVGQDPLRLLLDASERISDDLHQAVAFRYEPYIFARQWWDIEPWAEFRCFMQGGKLIGISQYNYFEAFERLPSVCDTIEWAIRERFFPEFNKACHLDDVVFDVFVRLREAGNERQIEVKLLEINPFFEMTDPCLFDWRVPFDGSFRVKRYE